MGCYFPLRAFDTGLKTAKGRPKLIVRPNASGGFGGVDVPCGRCDGCRLRYSRD